MFGGVSMFRRLGNGPSRWIGSGIKGLGFVGCIVLRTMVPMSVTFESDGGGEKIDTVMADFFGIGCLFLLMFAKAQLVLP
jgi:hypothetical protein